MSDIIKVRDKVSGEILTLRLKTIPETKKETTKQMVSPGVVVPGVNTDEAIQARGKIQDIAKDFMSPNPLRKGLGVLRTVGAPLTLFSAGVANPSLEMQKGNFNPIDLAKEAALGFSGQKLGRPIDVYRRAGIPGISNPVIASGLDFALTWSPVNAARVLRNSFGAVTKLTDKSITRAGDRLIAATEKASQVGGIALESFYGRVNNIPVNTKIFKSVLDDIPQALKVEVEKIIGKDFFMQPTIASLRKLKQLVGKYKPGIFGKEERGLAENIEGEKLNKLYSRIKDIIHKTISSKTSEKNAEALSKADEAFTKITDASNYIKKTITEPTLKETTKGGAMAKKLIQAEDRSGRRALTILKKSGARKEINKAVKALDAFNKWQTAFNIARHTANAAFYGGAIGGIGGYVASRIYNRNGE
jgi:hypothetical protein